MLAVAREESQRLSAADFLEEDFSGSSFRYLRHHFVKCRLRGVTLNRTAARNSTVREARSPDRYGGRGALGPLQRASR